MVFRVFRGITGSLILISIALGYCLSPYWLILGAVVGFMNLQSAFTGFCPGADFLRKTGLSDN
jgi:hypothetical protein